MNRIKEWHNIKCLVVDDDMFARAFIIAALNNIGLFCITEADSADSAIETLEETTVDIIFLDQQMPLKTGLDFLKELKDTDKKTPIVMVSVDTRSETITSAQKLGIKGYIIKPISSAVLKKTVRDILNFNQEG